MRLIRCPAAQDMNGNPLYNVNDTSSFSQRAGNYQCGGDTAAATCASAAPFYQSSGNYQIVSTTTYQTLSACANVVGCSTAVASSLLDISPQPDHTSLLAVGGNLYSVIQFEVRMPCFPPLRPSDSHALALRGTSLPTRR
jgi:hypothetical protein